MTPKQVTWVDRGMSKPSQFIEAQVILASCCRVPRSINCVLSVFNLRRFDIIQYFISSIHVVSRIMVSVFLLTLKLKWSCESSVYEYTWIPCRWAMPIISEVYKMNRIGLRTLPCGTPQPQSTGDLSDWPSANFTLCVVRTVVNERLDPREECALDTESIL